MGMQQMSFENVVLHLLHRVAFAAMQHIFGSFLRVTGAMRVACCIVLHKNNLLRCVAQTYGCATMQQFMREEI